MCMYVFVYMYVVDESVIFGLNNKNYISINDKKDFINEHFRIIYFLLIVAVVVVST